MWVDRGARENTSARVKNCFGAADNPEGYDLIKNGGKVFRKGGRVVFLKYFVQSISVEISSADAAIAWVLNEADKLQSTN